MENRSSLLDLVIEGPFQFDQFLRRQKIQTLASFETLLKLEPDLSIGNLLLPCGYTQLN